MALHCVLSIWISSKKLFHQCPLSFRSLLYELRKLLNVLNPAILFFHCRLKHSLSCFFPVCYLFTVSIIYSVYLFLIHLYLYFFRSNFICFCKNYHFLFYADLQTPFFTFFQLCLLKLRIINATIDFR